MGESVSFSSNGQNGTGYLAMPSSGSGPAVIVIQEWWGLVGHIKNVVDRFAAAGFVALAPDLYNGKSTAEPDEAKKLMMELQMKKAGEDIAGAANYLCSRSDVTSATVGAIGFCMGGTLAIWSATISEKISAAVGFYPGGSWERTNPTWSNYSGKAAIIHAAESDGTSQAPGIQEALREIVSAGGSATAFDYVGTKHAFFNEDRPEVYDAGAAKLAWTRTLDFLRLSVK